MATDFNQPHGACGEKTYQEEVPAYLMQGARSIAASLLRRRPSGNARIAGSLCRECALRGGVESNGAGLYINIARELVAKDGQSRIVRVCNFESNHASNTLTVTPNIGEVTIKAE